jgi:hypothetical protein
MRVERNDNRFPVHLPGNLLQLRDDAAMAQVHAVEGTDGHDCIPENRQVANISMDLHGRRKTNETERVSGACGSFIYIFTYLHICTFFFLCFLPHLRSSKSTK